MALNELKQGYRFHHSTDIAPGGFSLKHLTVVDHCILNMLQKMIPKTVDQSVVKKRMSDKPYLGRIQKINSAKGLTTL